MASLKKALDFTNQHIERYDVYLTVRKESTQVRNSSTKVTVDELFDVSPCKSQLKAKIKAVHDAEGEY